MDLQKEKFNLQREIISKLFNIIDRYVKALVINFAQRSVEIRENEVRGHVQLSVYKIKR